MYVCEVRGGILWSENGIPQIHEQRRQQLPSIPTKSTPRSPLSSAHPGLDGNINPAQILEELYVGWKWCTIYADQARVGPAQFVDGEGLALLNPIRTEWKMRGWNVKEIWHHILLSIRYRLSHLVVPGNRSIAMANYCLWNPVSIVPGTCGGMHLV